MRKVLVAVSACLVVIAAPGPASAWGTDAHRFIMGRAIDILPAGLKPFFEHYRPELIVRAVDPDVWRNAGWDENHNHFVDFGMPELGPYPFTALPREYGAALEKFGMTTLKKIGMLPWREAEEFGNLRRAFEGVGRGTSYAPSDVVLFSAVASHYIQDAHQPLHATNNYDGGLTQQNGIHARFETALFDRFAAKLTITPGRISAITNPRDTAFEVLLASHQLVDQLLQADRDAIAGKDSYDDQYFDRFFAAVRPMFEKRLADSVTATASLIVGAWEQAGKPALRTEMPRTVQRVRGAKPE
ncbi:MAG: hypothetical protein ABI868_05575 [Acidobacteriota bacterium]